MPPSAIDWAGVRSVLVIRLRSIGDTVLTTPALIALRRHIPNARIDVLLEDWVAPVLEGFNAVNEALVVGEGLKGRLSTIRELRRRRYDVVINLHGGTTSTMLAAASGARYKVGFAGYQYSFLYTHSYPPAIDFWDVPAAHSAEQQLALLGYAGIPVDDRPKSLLALTPHAESAIADRLENSALRTPHSAFAVLHPAAAFATKQWAVDKFARTAEFLSTIGFETVAITTRAERPILDTLRGEAQVPITVFDDLSLPEITALASRASLFVGNDSGIAHIAAAVGTSSVVIFGSSNRTHWRPWTETPHEIVFNEMPCQPCAGYTCEVFGEPRCILDLGTDQVFAAIRRVIEQEKAGTRPA